MCGILKEETGEREERNGGVFEAAGKAKTGGWTGKAGERVEEGTSEHVETKKRQPVLFTCDVPEGDGDVWRGGGCCMKTACKKDLRKGSATLCPGPGGWRKRKRWRSVVCMFYVTVYAPRGCN